MGEFWGHKIREAVEEQHAELPPGVTMQQQLALANQYRVITNEEFPWIIEELHGIAAGSGVDPLMIFALTIEEIWPEPDAPARTEGRCSDLVVGPPATADGRMLVAHNNDLDPSAEDYMLAVELRVPGEPVTFTIGGPPWLSVGFNDAGLAFTGNELSPNDEVIGIPRQLQFRAMLRERTIDDALEIALHPRRASSYNNIITDAHRVANVEGSATDAEVTNTGHGGWLAHTNHYACERMLPREGDPAYAEHSAVRLGRAGEMLGEAAPGTVNEESLRAMLSDHENQPDSLCRHPDQAATTKTVFWSIAEPGAGHIAFGRGNPCDSTAQEYVFGR